MADLFEFINETEEDKRQSRIIADETKAHRELIEKNEEQINQKLRKNAHDQSRVGASYLGLPFESEKTDGDFVAGYFSMPEMQELKREEYQLINNLDDIKQRATNIAKEEYMLKLETRSKAIIQRDNIKQVIEQIADENHIKYLKDEYTQVQQEIAELLKECCELRIKYESIEYSDLEALE